VVYRDASVTIADLGRTFGTQKKIRSKAKESNRIQKIKYDSAEAM
jgi:hypothetical protein